MREVNGILELEYMPQRANPERAKLFEPEEEKVDHDNVIEFLMALGLGLIMLLLLWLTSCFEVMPV